MLTFIRSSYFQGLLDSFSSGVIIFNTENKIYIFNKEAERIFRKPANECLSMNIQEIISHLEKFKNVEELIKKSITSGESAGPTDSRLVFPDTTVHYLTLHTSPLVYYDKLFGIFLEVKDVSHIYQLHEQEKQILEEKSRIEKQRVESLRQFTLAVAHQIRNPVTIIGGLVLRILKNKIDQQLLKKYLNAIIASSNRLERIVKEVTNYDAICGKRKIPVQISVAFKKVWERLREEFPTATEKIVCKTKGGEKTILLFPNLFDVALHEICRNSIEAIDPGTGEIRLTCEISAKTAIVSIHDTGRGIDPAINPYLLDPFFTTSETSTGMGLFKVEKIMREHGGTMETLANGQGGTVVNLYFPLTITDY